jgi:16S rRNA (adenine(1408)-N(1))-methyltransferase
MLVIKGNKTIKMEADEVSKLLEGYKKVIVDLGTGDGRFVYKNALKNPNNFYIGIDPSEKQLKISARDVQRKKLENVLFVVGSIEHLPDELKNVADEIFVNFPWGSLLETFTRPIESNLSNLIKLMKESGVIKVIFGYDELLEPSKTRRIDLPIINLDYIKGVLIQKYKKIGLKTAEYGQFDRKSQKVETTWYKRLNRSNRTWFYIVLSQY